MEQEYKKKTYYNNTMEESYKYRATPNKYSPQKMDYTVEAKNVQRQMK